MNASRFSFIWPDALWALLLLPLLVLGYLWLLHRRKNAALRWSSLAIVKAAIGSQSRWRRHVPPFMLLLALAVLVLAAARPEAVVSLPSQQETVVLAMDVSASMRAADVQPNRLAASQEAAKAFIDELPRHVRIAVVSFASSAAVVQAPTSSRKEVIAAINRFQLQRGTAIGSGIMLSLATLFPDAGIDLSQITEQRSAQPSIEDKPKPELKPVKPGSYSSAAIILLTDGQQTAGPDALEAAQMAADFGVRVYAVGIGTKAGQTVASEGWAMRVRLDEDTLKKIAAITQANYFFAGTAGDLKQVYQGLSSRMAVEAKESEITSLFAVAAALQVLAAAVLSLWWFGRIA